MAEQGSVERWKVCMNCEVVQIDVARACHCFGTGKTPRLVEVVRFLDYENMVAERDKWETTCDAHCWVIARAEDSLRSLGKIDGLDISDKVEALMRKATELRNRAEEAEGQRNYEIELCREVDARLVEANRTAATWKRRAESADRGRDAAVERRREIESKLVAGYGFCHPERGCEGQRMWLKAKAHAVEVEVDFDFALRRAHEILAAHGLEGAESGRDLSHWTLFGALNWLDGEIDQRLVELAQARAIEKRNSQRTVGVLVDWRDRARKAEHALRMIATGDVPGVSFADPDLVSEFAQDALDQLPPAGIGPDIEPEEMGGGG